MRRTLPLTFWIVIPAAGWFLLTECVFRAVDHYQAHRANIQPIQWVQR